MTATTHTIVGLYASRRDAEKAVQDLVDEGFSRDHISIVARDTSAAASEAARGDIANIGPQETIGSGTSAGTGAAVGGIAGFIAGIAALAVPGIGPILAAGPLAAGLMGAGLGVATGGIVGALKSRGIPDEHARRYSAAIGRGSCMVTVDTPAEKVDHAADILDRNGAINVDEPADHVTTGADISARTVTPEAIEAAKLKPGEGVRDRQREQERRVNVYPGITGGGQTTTSTT